MNKFLWNSFHLFFAFEHIISFRVIENKVKSSFLLFLWNLCMPNAAYLLIGILIDGLSKFMDPNIANVDNMSMLFVRIMKVFPLLTNYSILLINIVTIKQRRVLNVAKKIRKLIKVIDFDSNSHSFKCFERQCFMLLFLTQSLLVSGVMMNTFSIIKLQFNSFAVMTLLTWTMSSSAHITMICIFTMNFFAFLVDNVVRELVKGPNQLKSLCRLRCIFETIEEFKKVSSEILSLAFVKLLVEVLILVIDFQST